MPNREEEIQIRSEEVQEILSYVPNWMIRWGNTLVFMLILGLLLISWFVKYPDVIPTEVVVTTTVPPEKVYARAGGKMDALLIADNEPVDLNTILAVIENTADHQDVLLLKSTIDTLKISHHDFYFPIEKLPSMTLGEVAADYALFETNYSEYLLNKRLKPFSNEFIANETSIQEAEKRLVILISQEELGKQELVFKEKDLERQKKLYDDGIISIQAYEQKQLDFLQANRAYKNLGTTISQLKETIVNAKKTLKGTEIRKTQDETRLLKSVIQSFYQLKKSISDWELRYVLRPSIPGKVSYMSYWNQNQMVKQGDMVFTIIPGENSSFIGKIKAPSQNSGKIKQGQTVNIRLANYPSNEFGMLKGTVQNISLIPDNQGNYLIDVQLPEVLVTTYNQEIDFKQEMRGTAEIITEDLRLLERFFYKLKNIWDI